MCSTICFTSKRRLYNLSYYLETYNKTKVTKLLRTWGRSWSGSAGIPNRSSESLSKARNAQREFWPLVPCSLLTLPRHKSEAINNSEAIRTPCVCPGDGQTTSPCLIPVSASNPLKRPQEFNGTSFPSTNLQLLLPNHPLCSANFILWIHDMITWRPLTWSELYVTLECLAFHPPEDHSKQVGNSWNSKDT